MSPRKRILEYLKSGGPTSAAQLGEALGSTKMAVLQQLHTLEEQAVVRREAKPGVRGRPTLLWSLTPAAQKFFPDAHAELAVSLIHCLDETLGPNALDKLIKARSRHQLQNYRSEIKATSPLRRKTRSAGRYPFSRRLYGRRQKSWGTATAIYWWRDIVPSVSLRPVALVFVGKS